MAHPLAKTVKTVPVQNNLKNPHLADYVVVLPNPTWGEVKTRVSFTDDTATFFKALFKRLAPTKRVRFLYAVPYPTPGNRNLTPAEYSAGVEELKPQLNLFTCPVLLLGQGGLHAIGSKLQVSKTTGSWIDERHFVILNPAEVFKDPWLYRNFFWQFQRFIKRDVPVLHTPPVAFNLIRIPQDADPLLGYKGVFTFDIEATGVDFMKGTLTAIGIATPTDNYVFTKESLEWGWVRMIIQQLFESPDTTPVAHNAKFDMKWLMEYMGVKNREVEDTMLMHGAINEGGAGKPMPGQTEDSAQGHGLKLLVRLYLGWDNYAKDVSYNPTTTKEWEDLYTYLALDVQGTMRLYERLQEDMDERAWKLYHHYRALSYTLCHAEWRGVRFDVEKAKGLQANYIKAETTLKAQMESIVGEFNPNSTKQIQALLYAKGGVFQPFAPVIKDGKVTTDAEALRHLLEKSALGGMGTPRDWFIALLLEYRKVTKLRGTYIDGLLDKVDPNGFIHTDIKIVGTVTGRSSSAKPNLQNVPAPYTKLGKEIRSLFLANEDHLWISVDLSQAELRTVAYYAQDTNMINAYLGDGDLHTKTTLSAFPHAKDLDRKGAEFKRLRQAAKIVNFGVIYGLTASSLMEQINNIKVETQYGLITIPATVQITKQEAQTWIDGFFLAYPDVQPYMEREVATVFGKGYVDTPLHHRRVLGMIPKDLKILNEVINHIYNYKIQGTAGILTLSAGVAIHKAYEEKGWIQSGMAYLTLTVHDEWNITAHKSIWKEAGRIAKSIMESTPSTLLPNLPIPFASDLEVGYNWGYIATPKEDLDEMD